MKWQSAWLRRAMLALWDMIAWVSASAFVIGVRLDFRISQVAWDSVVIFVGTAVLILVALGYATRLYRGLYRVGSFHEAFGLLLLFGLVGGLELAIWGTVNPDLPRSVALLTPPLAYLLAAGGRATYRGLRDRAVDPRVDQRRALIYGAGDAGAQVQLLLRNDPASPAEVVGFVDDNPGKRHLRLNGIPVVADRKTLIAKARALDVELVVMAIPRADGALIGEIESMVRHAGIDFLVLPKLSEISGGRVSIADLRDVAIEDILGRREVATSLSEIASYLNGKRVLVTGAGGSIGSELCRQIHRFGPADLVMLDRDESALHAVQLSIVGHGLLDSPDTVLVDIRDIDATRKVFDELRPEIIFHTAALKHLPMLERFPEEGWKTNVLGTLNLLRLAEEFGAENFVNISTDKAADPTSVLGATKRLAEQLTSWQAKRLQRPYISVRFGNVLGSRGSVLYSFASQINKGGPVTVTHPDVTRFFMTIPEACELVTQAGAIGLPGQVMVLDMGQPVSILSVARRMIAMSGRSGIEIVFTGLRPGEKMDEVLFRDDESPVPTDHPLIRTVQVPPIDPDGLDLHRGRVLARNYD